MQISTLGIDLSKTSFHVIGLNGMGEIVLRRKLSRKQLLHFASNKQRMLIGMEACGGAHFLGRALRTQGHDARLMPAQFVKAFRKSNKNDYLDAEAIAEAVQRPTMRFVPIKTDDQLDLQALHRVRDRADGLYPVDAHRGRGRRRPGGRGGWDPVLVVDAGHRLRRRGGGGCAAGPQVVSAVYVA